MRIVVRLGDPLWRKVGARRLEWHFAEDDMTAERLLAHLAAMYPEAGADIRPDGTSIVERLPYHLFINQRKIPWDQLGNVTLHDGDQVALFLIVVGG